MKLFLIAALLPSIVAALGAPLWAGVVPPNRWYGVRTASSLASPDIWYRVNHIAGVAMVAAGVLGLVATAGVWALLKLAPEAKLALSTVLSTIFLLVAVIAPLLSLSR